MIQATSHIRIKARRLILLILLAGVVQAQEQSTQSDDEVLEEIVVMGTVVGRLDLLSESETGSRLGLSAFETPASIDVIDNGTMLARGFLSVTEAAETMVGVNSGENPAAPAAFSMRGFTDNQITTLRNGLRIGPASMVTRPQNTFNLARVEILKGPASVLYGEGSIAGTVNAVTKKPVPGAEQEWDFLGTYGRFATYQLGVGTGGSISDNTAYRLDVSRNGSDGWVDRTPSRSTNVTASLLTQLGSSVETMLSVDYLKDDLPNNWGQPILPNDVATQPITDVINTSDNRSIDKRNRFTNYNVGDDKSQSESLWLHFDLTWQLSDQLVVHNQSYHYSADRDWQNAEQYIYDDSSAMVTRDRFFVTHDQTILGNRIDIIFDNRIANRENRFLIGLDYNQIDFTRIKSFPDGDAVDLFNPAPGAFGALVESKKAIANIDTTAIYFEETMALTPQLRLVAGGRKEQIELDRNDFSWTSDFGGGDPLAQDSFDNTFKPFNWRAGLVYNLTPEVVAYGQFSTGKDPVGTELFSVESSEQFKLASSRMWEVGMKASLQNGDTEITFAYYDILREDLLTQIAQDQVANVGSQESNGFELSTSTRFTDNWLASFNAAYTNASYGNVFLQYLGDATGNTPPNVGKWTVNAWTSVNEIFNLPLEIGGGIRYIDDRYADIGNTIELKGYTQVNAFIAYSIDNYRIMLRSRNLFDAEYIPWVSPWYTNQVALGSPRTLELSVEAKF